MSYHVGRNNQPLGHFTEAEIREGLERGTFFTNDLIWREGMSEWKPLDQVFGFAAAYTLSAPMTALGQAVHGSAPPPILHPMGTAAIGIMPAPGTAMASLVLGIVALFTFFFCLVGGVLAVPGVICGHMALGEIKRSGGLLRGRGMAIAGLVTSYGTIVIALLFLVVFGLIFGIAAAAGNGTATPAPGAGG